MALYMKGVLATAKNMDLEHKSGRMPIKAKFLFQFLKITTSQTDFKKVAHIVAIGLLTLCRAKENLL